MSIGDRYMYSTIDMLEYTNSYELPPRIQTIFPKQHDWLKGRKPDATYHQKFYIRQAWENPIDAFEAEVKRAYDRVAQEIAQKMAGQFHLVNYSLEWLPSTDDLCHIRRYAVVGEVHLGEYIQPYPMEVFRFVDEEKIQRCSWCGAKYEDDKFHNGSCSSCGGPMSGKSTEAL